MVWLFAMLRILVSWILLIFFGWCRMWMVVSVYFLYLFTLWGEPLFWDRTLFPSVSYQFYYYHFLSVVLLFRFRFRCHPIALHYRRCHSATVVEDWLGAINSFAGVYIRVTFSVWIAGGFVGAPCRITVSWRYFKIAAALRSMSPYLPVIRSCGRPTTLFIRLPTGSAFAFRTVGVGAFGGDYEPSLFVFVFVFVGGLEW